MSWLGVEALRFEVDVLGFERLENLVRSILYLFTSDSLCSRV